MAAIGRLGSAIGKSASKKWPIFRKYAMVELTPPGPGDIPQITKEVGQLIAKGKTQAWKNTTVAEAVVNFAVCVEIGCWFFLGECIGKRSHMGYDIPGCSMKEAKIG